MRTCSTSSADVLKQTQIYTVEGEERDLQEYIFVELTGETMLVRCRYWVEYVCVCVHDRHASLRQICFGFSIAIRCIQMLLRGFAA